MKIFSNLFLASMLALGVSVTFTSCSKPCKDVVCENGGVEREDGDDCVCDCAAGYEGDLCQTEWRSQILGNYNVSDVVTSTDNPGNAGTYAYESAISAGTTVTDLKFSNFGGFNVTINGTLTSDSDIAIESQTDVAGRKFVGDGTVSATGNTITIDYTVTYTDGTQDFGTATYTKQ